MTYRVFTVEEKQLFAQEYESGTNLKDLATAAGVSIPTMAKYIRTGGGALRKPGVKSRGTGDFMKMVEKVNELMAQAQPAPEVVATDSTNLPVRKIMSFE
jgi:hypothetical protein